MHTRTRTALVTLVLNTVLTVLKFIAFAFTGSLAILAEAWHSFGDIATSATALLSVRSQAKRTSHDGEDDAGDEDPATASMTVESPPKFPSDAETIELPPDAHDAPDWPAGDSLDGAEEPAKERGRVRRGFARVGSTLRRAFGRFWDLLPEQKAALIIGLFLAGIGVALLRKVLTAEPSVVERPLVAGIAFLVFSVASYAVSRFELGVGQAEGSPALVADGLHARADATATLLTGVSLVLYYFGVNVDRFVAGLLGLIILSFAAETLVNLIVGVVKGEERYVLRHRTTDVLGAVLDPRTLSRAWERLGRRMAGGGPVSRAIGRALRAVPWVAAMVLVVWYASTAVYTVAPEQEAVVERFGRVINADTPAQPGPHLKAPWPVDRVFRVPSRRVRELSVGNQTRDGTVPMIWTRQHGTDEAFVSGDNNFFYPYLVIHYRVGDAYDYRYSLAEPDRVLEDVALQSLTAISAVRGFYGVALDERAVLGALVGERVQADLDAIDSGIEIVDVVVKDIHPPRDVARSFEGVVAAMQDHQTLINQARSYRNQKIPAARASAVRQLAEAHAYVAENKTRSEGEATRFSSRRKAYSVNRWVTRQRLYIDAMVTALTGRRKVIISPDAGRPDLWLDDTVSPPPKPKRGGDRDSSSRSGSRRK
jgi:HflK protein